MRKAGEWKLDSSELEQEFKPTFNRWQKDENESKQHWVQPILDGRRLYVGGLPEFPNQPSAEAYIINLFNGYEM
jgi:hypothetical protein